MGVIPEIKYFLPCTFSLSLDLRIRRLDQPLSGLFIAIEKQLDPLPEVWTLFVVRIGSGEKPGQCGNDAICQDVSLCGLSSSMRLLDPAIYAAVLRAGSQTSCGVNVGSIIAQRSRARRVPTFCFCDVGRFLGCSHVLFRWCNGNPGRQGIRWPIGSYIAR